MNDKRAILVVGAGDATGSAIARRFAREGYVACMTRRNAEKLAPVVDAIVAAGGEAHGFGSDARKEDEMVALVTLQIDSSLKLDDDTSASVRSSGLIGEKFISLKPGSSGTALKPGAIIVDTESAVDLEDIIARFAFGSVDKK